MKKKIEMSARDRRRFPRYPCSGKVEILQSGKRWGWGTVSDISRGGCYIETDHPLPKGAEAQIQLTIAGVFLDICALVVSSDPTFGMGMDFVVVPPEQWDKLPEIIEKVTNTETPQAVLQDETIPDESHTHSQTGLHLIEPFQEELPFRSYKRLAEAAMAQLTDAQFFDVLDPEMDSIAQIVQHMTMNMGSFLNDILSSSGDTPERNRDWEFAEPPSGREELMTMWESGWNLVFSAVEPLSPENMTSTAEASQVLQAANLQMAHYAYHCGQIVCLAKYFSNPSESLRLWPVANLPI